MKRFLMLVGLSMAPMAFADSLNQQVYDLAKALRIVVSENVSCNTVEDCQVLELNHPPFICSL